ncbi:MAG: aminoacyl-tRNA hydrolase, partial [Pseudobdellovibrionaceae bacterium]
KSKIKEQNILLIKPQTFMNLSGESVQAAMDFYKIPAEQVIVIHDDLDQAFTELRLHKNRGHGGHNGIRSIHQVLGHADYIRLKLGIGRPPHPEFSVADYVLQKFSKEEEALLPSFLDKAVDAIESILFKGYQQSANVFNSKK